MYLKKSLKGDKWKQDKKKILTFKLKKSNHT